jgi:hypothetical protein
MSTRDVPGGKGQPAHHHHLWAPTACYRDSFTFIQCKCSTCILHGLQILEHMNMICRCQSNDKPLHKCDSKGVTVWRTGGMQPGAHKWKFLENSLTPWTHTVTRGIELTPLQWETGDYASGKHVPTITVHLLVFHCDMFKPSLLDPILTSSI